MLEQQKHPNEDKINSVESSGQRKDKENVMNTLEKARVFHEKYLLRSNSNDLESAVNYYIQAIKQNPSIPETYYRLASLLFENGQISLDSAIEQCKNVTFKMAELSQTALFKAMDLLQNYKGFIEKL